MLQKQHTRGTHRVRSPRETVEDFRRVMPRLGITRLANVTGLDDIGLPVWVAIRPNSRSLSVSQGKGLDSDAARASALMESIELWHAEHVEAPLAYEAPLALGDRATLDVHALPIRRGSVLRPDLPMLWIEGEDLLAGRRVLVPFEMVTMNTVAPPRFVPTFAASSNGLASGNHRLEAIAHALCEVIERDAITLFRLAGEPRRKARQLDLATVDDPGCRQVLDRLDAAGVEVAAWDITSDLGVPVAMATVLDRDDRVAWRALGAFWGYGCHLDPAVALGRALTEAVQSRLTMIAGSRDDCFPADYRATASADLGALRARLRDPAPAHDFRALPRLAGDDLASDVRRLLDAVAGAGLGSAAVVDLSRAELGIPVVKVVVPGLEGLSTAAQYTPGARARARLEASA